MLGVVAHTFTLSIWEAAEKAMWVQDKPNPQIQASEGDRKGGGAGGGTEEELNPATNVILKAITTSQEVVCLSHTWHMWVTGHLRAQSSDRCFLTSTVMVQP